MLGQWGSFCAYATTRIGTHESWVRNPVSRLGAVWQFRLRCWTQAIYVVMLRRSSNICYGISERVVDCTPFRLPDGENLSGFAIVQQPVHHNLKSNCPSVPIPACGFLDQTFVCVLAGA